MAKEKSGRVPIIKYMMLPAAFLYETSLADSDDSLSSFEDDSITVDTGR